MNYKDKFGGETIQAVQVKDNIKSIKEALRFIGKEVPEDKELFNVGFAAYCGILSMNGIKIDPCKVAHTGDYIAKYKDGSVHVFKEDEFKEYYKSADDIGSIKVQLDLDTHEYDALLAEAKKTADKLNSMLRKLKNYRVESIQGNDRLHCTCVLKPGE